MSGDGEDGLTVEVHHHEVATAGQCEIGTGAASLVRKADEVLMLKYCVHNVAAQAGMTATFMPKPLVGDNGSGMHVHQSLSRSGTNIMAGDLYGGLSQEALYYIGGIIKHAQALNAFTNASTNSYKRLVPGFEAPVMLAYSARNRSASIRIPYVMSPKARRIEVRFPDSMGNPYFSFAAMMMAGLDGVINKIDPGQPIDKDLYDLPAEEEAAIPQGLLQLRPSDGSIGCGSWVSHGRWRVHRRYDRCIHRAQSRRVDPSAHDHTHPVEFDMYYSL